MKQFYEHIMQKLVKQVNSQKSTNNPMSSFGLIEENIELCHIHLAVKFIYSEKALLLTGTTYDKSKVKIS